MTSTDPHPDLPLPPDAVTAQWESRGVNELLEPPYSTRRKLDPPGALGFGWRPQRDRAGAAHRTHPTPPENVPQQRSGGLFLTARWRVGPARSLKDNKPSKSWCAVCGTTDGFEKALAMTSVVGA
jgi:hypothetical protein